MNLARRSVLVLIFLCAGGGAAALAQAAGPPLNLPSEIGERISKCWRAPQGEPGQVVEVTVRLRFSSAGAVIGEPRVSYVRAAEDGLRKIIVASILAAVKACTPLPLTPSLGAAIAGRMVAIRFSSLSSKKKAEHSLMRLRDAGTARGLSAPGSTNLPSTRPLHTHIASSGCGPLLPLKVWVRQPQHIVASALTG